MSNPKNPSADLKKQLELQREDRQLRMDQDFTQSTKYIELVTGAFTGVALGVNSVRMEGIKVAEAKAKAFAGAFETLVDAGLPKVAAYEAAGQMFGMPTPDLSGVNDGAAAVADELRAMHRTIADLEREAKEASQYMAEEIGLRQAVRDSFDNGQDEPGEGTRAWSE